MAKKRRRRTESNDKIIYIDNEQELFDWAMSTAAKYSPELKIMFYEATEPKEVIKLAEEAGIKDERAMLKVASILAGAGQTGMFLTKDDITEERFKQFMYGWYIPRMREVHDKSVNWFKYLMGTSAPDIVNQLADAGWNGNAEYVGSAGNIAHYNVYGVGGMLLARVDFDPSKKTFNIWWEGAW